MFEGEEGPEEAMADGSFMLSPRRMSHRMSQRLASLRSSGSVRSPMDARTPTKQRQVTRKEAFGKYSTNTRIAAQARVGMGWDGMG